MENSNYVTIQGWMVNELKLKGNELILFALIYGFCQDIESEFKGSLSYISKTLSCSRTTSINLIKKLVDAQLIVKEVQYISNLNLPRYKIHPFTFKKIRQLTGGIEIVLPEVLTGGTKTVLGSKETVPGGGTKTVPHNTIIDSNTDSNNIIIDWRKDFQIYLKELREVYNELINDSDYIKQQEKFNPNLDIKLTLEKSCTNYWATEAGWKKKKQGKSKVIDWKSTLTNALTLKMNKVYKPFDQQKQENQEEKIYRNPHKRLDL
jgi:DNA-binding Lrp family transcriptional regulator